MKFKNNEIIIVLGAGASIEADIPDSTQMIEQIQNKISSEDRSWNCFRDLYWYIRSSVFYADGLEGKTGDDVRFDIERLVDVLEQLKQKEGHALYPFIGAWSPKLIEVAGKNFHCISEFLDKILNILRTKWLALQKKESAGYYSNLLRFQEEYQYPLRVFSLNYDLCVEKVCGLKQVQRGFHERKWDWRQFDEGSHSSISLKLYKLHGSIDWYFTEDRRVTYSDTISSIQDQEIAMIFGTAYKLQYIDPFLFLAYELRKWSIDTAQAIICIGYGFRDKHINGILEQSLRHDRKRRLLAVIGPINTKTIEEERIQDLLDCQDGQIKIDTCGAKKFLNEKLNLDFISKLFPKEADLFGTISNKQS